MRKLKPKDVERLDARRSLGRIYDRKTQKEILRIERSLNRDLKGTKIDRSLV